MKCKHCDGNGGYWDMNRWCFCEQCDGTGQDGLSNDEWRRTCSAEEFATWLWKHFDHEKIIVLWEKYGYPMYKDDTGIGRADYTKAMKKWLKEKHNVEPSM